MVFADPHDLLEPFYWAAAPYMYNCLETKTVNQISFCRLTESDVIFNQDQPWNKTNIATIVTHEVGHSLGLGHSPYRDAIMYWAAPVTRGANLHQDDINGIRFLYPLASSDLDRDGYTYQTEIYLGTDPNKACITSPSDIDTTKPGRPSKTWPADLYTEGNSLNKIAIEDVTSFLAPTRHINTSPGDIGYDRRWDLVPGRGILGADINIQDLTSLTTLKPLMFDGQNAYNGPSCNN